MNEAHGHGLSIFVFFVLLVLLYVYTKRTKRVHCPFRIHAYFMKLKSISSFDHLKVLCCVYENKKRQLVNNNPFVEYMGIGNRFEFELLS